jgi:RNA polymerase sigma factor (sigma-70 family)
MQEYLDSPPLALSFGQQKRISIAAVLAMRSRIIMMDEPTAGQDYWNYMAFMDAILQMPGFDAIIFITHDLDLARNLADDTAVSQETQLADDEEKGIRMSLLQEAMEELTDREKHILTERRLKDDPVTLEELAGQYGVSRERVRQIEVRAFEKLQKAMRAAAEERNLVDA